MIEEDVLALIEEEALDLIEENVPDIIEKEVPAIVGEYLVPSFEVERESSPSSWARKCAVPAAQSAKT